MRAGRQGQRRRTLLSGARRLSFKAEPVNHHLGVSAFATHAVVARESCVKIDPDLPLELAALFGCAVLTGVGAVINTARIEPGASVAVVGLGGVGLSAILGAKVAGARQIVAVDLSDEKLAFARALGATDAVNAGAPDAVQAIRALTGGGVEVAFDMAGAVPALELAYAVTARGGTTVTAGLPHPDKRMALAPVTLVAEERTLKGSYIGSAAPLRDVPRLIAPVQGRQARGRRAADAPAEARRHQRGFRPPARRDRGQAGRDIRLKPLDWRHRLDHTRLSQPIGSSLCRRRFMSGGWPGPSWEKRRYFLKTVIESTGCGVCSSGWKKTQSAATHATGLPCIETG